MTELGAVAEVLRAGGVAIIPTDTVYGIAASINSDAAIKRLFDLKQRPEDKAIPVLAASLQDLAAIAELGPHGRALADAFWPGPLTIVVARAQGFDADLGGEPDGSIAVRVPDHPLALDLLRSTGPLAVTSANLSGEPPITSAVAARRQFGKAVAAHLVGGVCDGRPSTVLSLIDPPSILRAGSLDAARLLQIVTE